MTPSEAAKFLDLPVDAKPEQLEARFLELRRKLEEKVVRAPTPGLQAKYRQTLADVTEAFETLTLAADTDSLPALRRITSVPAAPAAPVQPAPAPAATPAPESAPAVAVPAAARSSRVWPAVRVGVLLVLLVGVVIGGRYWNDDKAAEMIETATQKVTDLTAEEPAPPEPRMSDEEADLLWWREQTFEQRLANLDDEWRQVAPLGQRYQEGADSAMQRYRQSPDRPIEVRAETFVRAQTFAEMSRNILKATGPGGELYQRKQAVDAMIKRGDAREIEAQVKACAELRNALRELHYQEEEITGQYRTWLEINSEPAGLTWTIETKFDGGQALVISGTTPERGYKFVGRGDGTLRIKHPGKPDHVVPLTGIGIKDARLREDAVFK